MAQFARADGDIGTGGWTPTPLYPNIDEVSYDEADYIEMTNLNPGTAQLSLSNVTDPGSSSGHTMRVRAKRTLAATLSVQLFQGTTQIASLTPTLTTAWADYEYTLSSAEADAITDYSDLRVKLVGTATSSSRYVHVAWFEFEVPDTSSGFTGSLDKTLDGISGSISGSVSVAGSLSKTLDNIGKNITGSVSVSGSFGKTLDGISVGASGTVGNAPISGSLNKTLDGISRSIAGSVGVTGSLNKTLAGISISASGGTPSILGSANISLSPIGISAAGSVRISGSLSKTLDSIGIYAYVGAGVSGFVRISPANNIVSVGSGGVRIAPMRGRIG